MYSVEEFDKQKTKVMNYIMYKKRTEYEVRNKFSQIIPQDLLEDIIEYVKEVGYLSDSNYIKKAVQEFMLLKNLSVKEIVYKLYAKGINKNELEDYIYENEDELYEYERQSATNIYNKKINSMEENDIKNYLLKKGYKQEIVNDIVKEQ